MPVKTAVNNYLGQAGCKRMNCAQAVISAFQEKYELDEDTVELFRAYGGGRAPGGVCGAFYAVKYILEHCGDAKRIAELEQYFSGCAGSLKCNDIRQARTLSCVECVEKCSEYLAAL
ncbi:MAG: C-GCAxxG-C-C family protein [Clostridia bacterium]|nr:C-GCAxxG-C-C family protein [Clostridia bacterium]